MNNSHAPINVESPRGRASIQKKKYCYGTYSVLFLGLEFLKKPSVLVEGVPPPAAHLPAAFLPPSPCSQSPEVTGTLWSLSQ